MKYSPHVAEVVIALCERLWVAHDALDVLLLDTRQSKQRVLHAELVFADDEELIPARTPALIQEYIS